VSTGITPSEDLALLQSLPFKMGELLVGKYRVERVLGVGGMGVVVAATHVDLDRLVAVKVIRSELASHEDNVQRLLLEARAAARIQSEHVGKVLDVGRLDSGEPYIVMEYLHGYDLARYLEQKGHLETVESIDLLLQACEALAEAHDAGIVHRDLKPENLFLTPLKDGSHLLKVLDFGISKHLSEAGQRALTTPQTAIGSPQYMAPEQMQAEAVDIRVDVWSLGAILYELLTGYPAFEGDTLPVVCARVLSGQPVPLLQRSPNTPSAVDGVVTACLQKDRNRRLPNVRAFVDALAPFGGPQSRLLHGRIVGQAHASTQQLFPQAATSALSGEVPPASRTVAVNRSLSRGPIYLAMLGVVVLGFGAFWLAQGTTMHTRPPLTFSASAGESALPPSVERAAPSLATHTQVQVETEPAELAPAPSATPQPDALQSATVLPGAVLPGAVLPSAVLPNTVKPNAMNQPAIKALPRQAPAPGSNGNRKTDPAARSPKNEAWDDGFGGRH